MTQKEQEYFKKRKQLAMRIFIATEYKRRHFLINCHKKMYYVYKLKDKYPEINVNDPETFNAVYDRVGDMGMSRFYSFDNIFFEAGNDEDCSDLKNNKGFFDPRDLGVLCDMRSHEDFFKIQNYIIESTRGEEPINRYYALYCYYSTKTLKDYGLFYEELFNENLLIDLIKSANNHTNEKNWLPELENKIVLPKSDYWVKDRPIFCMFLGGKELSKLTLSDESLYRILNENILRREDLSLEERNFRIISEKILARQNLEEEEYKIMSDFITKKYFEGEYNLEDSQWKERLLGIIAFDWMWYSGGQNKGGESKTDCMRSLYKFLTAKEICNFGFYKPEDKKNDLEGWKEDIIKNILVRNLKVAERSIMNNIISPKRIESKNSSDSEEIANYEELKECIDHSFDKDSYFKQIIDGLKEFPIQKKEKTKPRKR